MANVLIIGDTHLPFEHVGYLEFCKDVYKQYKCTRVVHIGDVIDNHAVSFHDHDPDGYGAGEELKQAIHKLGAWHKAFPNTDSILGNHCRLVQRQAFKAGISINWLRSMKDVLNVPTWTFHQRLIIDDVLYVHGEGVTARTKAMREGCSVVQGHRHTEAYVWYQPKAVHTHFGMQVGTGIDASAYAFAYAKDHDRPVLSCGVVVDGIHAHVVRMKV